MCRTEELIAAVKDYPMLYDLSHAEYRNVPKKNQVWDKLGRELDENAEELKKRWKNLRDTYAKYLRSMKMSTGRNTKKNYKHWPWAQQMMFLKPFLIRPKTDRKSAPNGRDSDVPIEKPEPASEPEDLDTQNDELLLSPQNHNAEGNLNEFQSMRERRGSNARKRKLCTTEPMMEISPVNDLNRYVDTNPRRPHYDGMDLIFLGYATTAKTFSLRRQAVLKMRIAQVMLEEELAHVDESSLDPSVSSSRPSSPASGLLSPTDTSNFPFPSTSIGKRAK